MFMVTESLCSVQDAAWLPGAQEEGRGAQRVEDSFILVFNPGPQTPTPLLQLPQPPTLATCPGLVVPFGRTNSRTGRPAGFPIPLLRTRREAPVCAPQKSMKIQ